MQEQKQPNKTLMILLSIPWLDIIQTLLAILRITNVITWSWWIVLLPLWIYDVIYVLSIIVGFIAEKLQKNNPQPLPQQPMMPGAMGPQAAYNSLSEEEKAQINPELLEAMKNTDMSQMTPVNMSDIPTKERDNTDGKI